eukprot:comp24043_c0_seq2/m.43098 comp24043_c0_seq2/g.43098  ORF comp24043_c0_seq2/g.43098 comp24043_c0_seq2/m.43098 type:complete len:1076 (-) comp24043_c0_seq2:246-3473(-)
MNSLRGPPLTEALAQQLLDFSRDLDVGLLEAVVNTVYSPTTPQQQALANQTLMQFKALPDAWTRVDRIIELSTNQQTKYFGLSILEETIKTKWKSLPPEQREAIKGYIVGLVISTSTNVQMVVEQKLYLQKMNQILVQILKQEWPHNWQSFIPDIVAASRTNETMCQNNMVILKLLSEEVFDFSSGQMTHRKARKLKDTMCEQFGEVFQLCMFVLDNTSSNVLIKATLETLLRFLSWIPLGYMFETDLISRLHKYLGIPQFRNIALQCLTEIGCVKLEPGQYASQLGLLYMQTLESLKIMVPPGTNMPRAYRTGTSEEQDFVRFLSLFFTGFLKEHAQLLETTEEAQAGLLQGLEYLVQISDVDETEIFKICLEYWNSLAEGLYNESPYTVSTMQGGLMLNTPQTPRRGLYAPVLSKVRHVMISHMVKPEEVLIVENESGEIVREFMPQHTDTLNQYRAMRETLVYLTHLDCVDTKNIMTERLHRQTDESQWSWKSLNTLCWAVGSISGAMSEEDEKGFLVTVIKYLLMLVEMKRGKDNKAVVASNIMYIVGQYPRFLRAHWKFLKTVVHKLFEFMHETHEGVQDMACDTFIKIAQKCRRYFVAHQQGEPQPFIDEILSQMNTIICDLQPQQIHTFYEAVGYMISAQMDPMVRENLIDRLMVLPNSSWEQNIQLATQNLQAFVSDPERIKQVINVLKTNVAACSSIGQSFVIQLGRIYMDLLSLYRCMSEIISQNIATQGPDAIKNHHVKQLRLVKKETLKLIDTFLGRTDNGDMTVVRDNFVPPLLDVVLSDYRASIPAAREPEVLSVLATLISALKGQLLDKVPAILDAVFECTLDMINKDLSEFPDHRTNFFKMLEAIVTGDCFAALFVIPEGSFRLVMESIYWAMKHTMRNVSETGLNILMEMLRSIVGTQAAPFFYQSFYLSTLEHIFATLADSAYQSGFKQLCDILALMLSYAEENVITTPLAADQPPGTPASVFVRQYLANLLSGAFPNVPRQQLEMIIERMCLEYKDPEAFKTVMQDFLVRIKADGTDELEVLEEQQTLVQEKEKRQRAVQAIPGMLNPYANDTMAD